MTLHRLGKFCNRTLNDCICRRWITLQCDWSLEIYLGNNNVKLELSAFTLFINLYCNTRERLILIRDDDYENDGLRKI